MDNAKFDLKYAEKLEKEKKHDELWDYACKFANEENPDAIAYKGMCYDLGYGIEEDKEAAFTLYSAAAELNSPSGINCLAIFYRDGICVENDSAKAINLFKKAAGQGHATAQNNLGNCFYYGRGVAQSYKKAVEWYTKAAEHGYISAQFNLGSCYLLGKGVAQSYEKAVECFTKAAEQGNADAQYNLGYCYYHGEGVAQSYEKAVKWYTKAAEQGHATAQNNLGNCFYYGRGVAQSYKKAVEWYTKAAEQGNAKAQNKLGDCYYFGEGVEQDYEKAVECFTKAAEQGNADAFKDEEMAEKSTNILDLLRQIHETRLFAKADKKNEKLWKQLEETRAKLAEYMSKSATLSPMDFDCLQGTMLMQFAEMRKDMMSGFEGVHEHLDKIEKICISASDEIKSMKGEYSQALTEAKANNDESKVEEISAKVASQVTDYLNKQCDKLNDTNEDEIAVEESLLKGMFGNLWDELDAYTRRSLISARVFLSAGKKCNNKGMDFSGVCISATSALEHELKKRFFTNYRSYLERTYGDNMDDWPLSMLYWDNSQRQYNSSTIFTLGSLPFIIGTKEGKDGNRFWSIDDFNLVKQRMEEYTSVLFKDGQTHKVSDMSSFVDACEAVRETYRNPAAHDKAVNCQLAENCCNTVIGLSDAAERIGTVQGLLFRLVTATKSNI